LIGFADFSIVAKSPVKNVKTRHREVFDTLLGQITSGQFRPGDRLPTETELAKTFSASRATVARAMRELKGRGLLNRQRGGGTRIAVPDEGMRIALFAPFAPNANTLGYVGGQIHTHLSDLASRRGDDLRLQLATDSKLGLLDRMLTAVDELVDKRVNGVFYYPIELPPEQAHYNRQVVDKLKASRLAVVLVDRDIVSFPDRSRLPLVTYDNRRGGYIVTDHMIRQGCRRIAFVGTPLASSAASDRWRGYRDAIEDNEIDANFCRALVERGRPDAIVCKMDHYAALVGRQLVAMGLEIGRDIRLAGFDDQPFASLLPVPLTTVHFPFEPFVTACYDRLTRQLADPGAPDPGVTLIDAELVIRASTQAPAAPSVVRETPMPFAAV
jgi:GntR family transcriptional regulator of arabinose operon